MKLLTRQEEMILIIIFRLENESSLVKIRENFIRTTGKDWSISSIYVPLDRLEKKGFLECSIGEPEARRGGRAVKLYRLTKKGLRSLEEMKTLHDVLWKGIEQLAVD